MKALHVIPRYWPAVGGSERHLQEISERLARAGHEVTVVTTDALDLDLFWNPKGRRIPVATEVHNGVQVRRYPVRHLPGHRYAFGAIRRAMAGLGTFPLNAWQLLQPLGGFVPWLPDLHRALASPNVSYDVVHAMNTCFEAVLASSRSLAARQNIPYIITPLLHLGESDHSIVRRYYTMPQQVRLIAQADAILAQTPIEIDFLQRRGIKPGRIVEAGVGVNPRELLGGVADRFRNRTGITGPIVAAIGACAYDKGSVHLVEAGRRLRSRGGPGRAVEIVLAGQPTEGFRRYHDSLPPAERDGVHLLGPIPEDVKLDLLAACSLLAMPSRTDSFGIAFLEGWFYGKPVIGARAGGIPAVIDHGSDGLLVEFGDVSALAARIGDLLSDPALAGRLGETGQSKVLRRYTWDRVFPIVEEVYERLCPHPVIEST
jgi:glycosyltransferase involved in cell wall biosynthesis